MKRLSYAQREQHIRRARRRHGRLVKCHARERRARERQRRSNFRRTASDRSRIVAPRFFSLTHRQGRKSLLLFIDHLRTAFTAGGSVTLDFSSVRKLVVDGTLLFKAELHRLLEVVDSPPRIQCKRASNKKVEQVFVQVGIYGLLGVHCTIKPIDDDVVMWRSAVGANADGSQYEEIFNEYDGEIADAMQDRLYVPVTEAMSNVVHHAYIAARQDGIDTAKDCRKWWMFSQQRGGNLTVALCDLGAGISGTLPLTKPWLWTLLKAVGRDVRDGRAIDEAIKESTTRTLQSNRGKGLGQIVRTIGEHEMGRVMIMSNKGAYSLDRGRKHVSNYPASILGTLILWELPLPEQVNKQ